MYNAEKSDFKHYKPINFWPFQMDLSSSPKSQDSLIDVKLQIKKIRQFYSNTLDVMHALETFLSNFITSLMRDIDKLSATMHSQKLADRENSLFRNYLEKTYHSLQKISQVGMLIETLIPCNSESCVNLTEFSAYKMRRKFNQQLLSLTMKHSNPVGECSHLSSMIAQSCFGISEYENWRRFTLEPELFICHSIGHFTRHEIYTEAQKSLSKTVREIRKKISHGLNICCDTGSELSASPRSHLFADAFTQLLPLTIMHYLRITEAYNNTGVSLIESQMNAAYEFYCSFMLENISEDQFNEKSFLHFHKDILRLWLLFELDRFIREFCRHDRSVKTNEIISLFQQRRPTNLLAAWDGVRSSNILLKRLKKSIKIGICLGITTVRTKLYTPGRETVCLTIATYLKMSSDNHTLLSWLLLLVLHRNQCNVAKRCKSFQLEKTMQFQSSLSEIRSFLYFIDRPHELLADSSVRDTLSIFRTSIAQELCSFHINRINSSGIILSNFLLFGSALTSAQGRSIAMKVVDLCMKASSSICFRNNANAFVQSFLRNFAMDLVGIYFATRERNSDTSCIEMRLSNLSDLFQKLVMNKKSPALLNVMPMFYTQVGRAQAPFVKSYKHSLFDTANACIMSMTATEPSEIAHTYRQCLVLLNDIQSALSLSPPRQDITHRNNLYKPGRGLHLRISYLYWPEACCLPKSDGSLQKATDFLYHDHLMIDHPTSNDTSALQREIQPLSQDSYQLSLTSYIGGKRRRVPIKVTKLQMFILNLLARQNSVLYTIYDISNLFAQSMACICHEIIPLLNARVLNAIDTEKTDGCAFFSAKKLWSTRICLSTL